MSGCNGRSVKKLIYLVLAAVLACVTAGCGGTGKTGPADPEGYGDGGSFDARDGGNRREDETVTGRGAVTESEAADGDDSGSGTGAGGTEEDNPGPGTGAGASEKDAYGSGVFPESIAVRDVNESSSPYFGVMHIRILDVSGEAGESGAVYAFTEKNDPENAWSVTGLELGDIETELGVGAEAVILFHGDVINDSENIEFIAALPEGEYTMRAAAGETISNTMGSFTLRTDSGEEISFIKDNCRMEEGALSSDSGDDVVVYYADGGELGSYPMSIYKRQGGSF